MKHIFYCFWMIFFAIGMISCGKDVMEFAQYEVVTLDAVVISGSRAYLDWEEHQIGSGAARQDCPIAYFHIWDNGSYDYRSASRLVIGLKSNTTYYYYAYFGDKKDITKEFVIGETKSFTTLVADRDYEWVDLGLSVLWATCNVGALSIEGYGIDFAWGETVPKSSYDWDTYKFGTRYALTRYCSDSRHGLEDNKTTLEMEDDAAHVNWGGSWRMPTKAEQDELINKCTWKWTTQNGVSGFMVTGKNGNSIFMRGNTAYWSSTLNHRSWEAYDLYLQPTIIKSDYDDRCYGYQVRAVCPIK